MIYDYGIDGEAFPQNILLILYVFVLSAGIISIAGRYLIARYRLPERIKLADIVLGCFLVLLITGAAGVNFLRLFDHRMLRYLGIFLVLLREFSEFESSRRLQYLNPAQLFVFSYIVIISLGTVLLMFPNATYSGISAIDALFTATSAFCITGLVVVETGSSFTPFGQVIILALFQFGGIGIMTFTSFFTYIFTGGSTYGNSLLLKDMTNSEKIAEVFSTVRIIILFTLAIEAVGALFIYFSLDSQVIPSVDERIFFSVFHSVSGFCSAGFTLMTDSLYNSLFRFNYSMHLIIAFLFIVGGLGFPIVHNFFRYVRHYLVNRIMKSRALHVPWVVTINTRIVLITTLILFVAGTVFFYIFEYDNTLAEHEGAGKIITAFFGAATPRSAGFNTIDTSALTLPALMLVMFLMWIGAGPGSTGGGIRVTTFAISIMNVVSIARGKDRIEAFGREISDSSVRRAFAVILFSFIIVGSSIFLISIIEEDRELLAVAFECFSSYGTVGLSMGITGELADASKLIIVFNMFTGRIGMIVIMLALLKKVKHLNYRYPEENISIT